MSFNKSQRQHVSTKHEVLLSYTLSLPVPLPLPTPISTYTLTSTYTPTHTPITSQLRNGDGARSRRGNNQWAVGIGFLYVSSPVELKGYRASPFPSTNLNDNIVSTKHEVLLPRTIKYFHPYPNNFPTPERRWRTFSTRN